MEFLFKTVVVFHFYFTNFVGFFPLTGFSINFPIYLQCSTLSVYVCMIGLSKLASSKWYAEFSPFLLFLLICFLTSSFDFKNSMFYGYLAVFSTDFFHIVDTIFICIIQIDLCRVHDANWKKQWNLCYS